MSSRLHSAQAHIAERASSHYLPMFVGFSTTCCPDRRQVAAYLPEVRPSWFFAVPRIWAKLKTSSPVIGQAIAIGDGRPYNVALITLDPDVAPAYEQQHGREALLAEVERGIEAGNEQLARVEQIKKFKLLDGDWQPGGDELTPTMKLKRKPIHEKYAGEIEELYA